MQWIAVFLPDLALQAHHAGALGHLTDVPLVISEGSATRPVVHAANAAARGAGIHAAMPVAAAQARAQDLIVLPRDPAREDAALERLALWLTQFSPMVCRESAGAVLEVTATLRLFGGLGALVGRIRGGLPALGFKGVPGIAPTPRAAWLLARMAALKNGVRMCREPAELDMRLADIPLALFDWPHASLETLATLGFTRVSDLLRQPRAGLVRRFGAALVDDLDRARGLQADPREPLLPPQVFRRGIDLPFEITDAALLLRPLGVLLEELQGFLVARGAATDQLELHLAHHRAPMTTHRFGASAPLRRTGDWLRLMRERLERAPLPEPVHSLTLAAGRLTAYHAPNASWLPDEQSRREQWSALLNRIVSRLGRGSVALLEAIDDHRPEAAQRTVEEPRARYAVPTSPRRARPLLLLPAALPLACEDGRPRHRGALELLAGPERIEAGWWDGRAVARDYFVARNPEREVCWIYCEAGDRGAGGNARRWYLQGYFA
ncbi:MAG TPA: DNA polymerase Y family protein [Usitatibacteraceae bacterium]|nr:DNA polymerase Y family protein [Usitatibacteraceae bacterium]